MKFIDINREFTAAANSYMAQGYYINAGTMGGSQGEVAHIDLTNGTEIIRVLLTTFNNYLGTEGVELIVGRVKDDIKPNVKMDDIKVVKHGGRYTVTYHKHAAQLH